MVELDAARWLALAGLGAAWHGLQILIVGGWPHSLRKNRAVAAGSDPSLAFQRFWIEQYRLIGFVLAIGGLALAAWGLAR